MDRNDITCYLDEKEILLQAGLRAKILKVEKEQNEVDDTLTVFYL